MSGDLRALERTIGDAVASLNQANATEDQKRAARETIDRVFQEQLQAFNDPARKGIHDHPAIALLAEGLSQAAPEKKIEAALIMGYLNSLGTSDAANKLFPGYNRTTKSFDGIAGLPLIEQALKSALTQAQEGAFSLYAGKSQPAAPALSGLKLPEGVNAPVSITVDKVSRDLALFDEADGVNRIADMRQHLSANGTLNPYQYTLMTLAAQIKAAELQQKAAGFQNLTGGQPQPAFNREAFIREQVPKLFTGLAQLDREVPIDSIGKANGFDPGKLEDVKEGLRAQMSGTTLVAEALNLSKAEGFMGWALKTYMANNDQFQTAEDVQRLFTDPDRIIRLLGDAPGMTQDRAKNMAEHARYYATYNTDFEAAQKQGLTIGQLRLHRVQGNGPFLARHVAQALGAPQIIPASVTQTDTVGSNYRADNSGGPYRRQVLILDSGFMMEGERLSSGVISNGKGDGLRLGMMNFQGTLEPPAPELYFRHTLDSVGKLDFGLLGHQDGDTDGLIRTSRPWVDDHFEGHGEILGARYSGRDFKIGSGTLSPSSTLGAEHGDLFANAGLTLNQPLSDNVSLRTGVSGTYATRPRVDAFGEVSANLTNNFNLGSDTYWRTGLHATQWMEPEERTLGTAYTQLELNSAGNHWYSNLRHVFGVHVNTDENYGVYSEHTKRFDLGPLGTPDAGVRVEYEREDGAKAGAVAGWKF